MELEGLRAEVQKANIAGLEEKLDKEILKEIIKRGVYSQFSFLEIATLLEEIETLDPRQAFEKVLEKDWDAEQLRALKVKCPTLAAKAHIKLDEKLSVASASESAERNMSELSKENHAMRDVYNLLLNGQDEAREKLNIEQSTESKSFIVGDNSSRPNSEDFM